MKRKSIIAMMVSAVLTALFLLLWAAGFLFAGAAVGNLIHLFLLLSFVTGLGFIVGLAFLLISLVQKK